MCMCGIIVSRTNVRKNATVDGKEQQKTLKSDYVSNEEAEKLISSLPYEYRGIVYAAVETGFRIGDLCSAKAWNFDKNESTLTIVEQKTGKSRTVGVTPKLLRVLEGLDGRGIETLCYRTYLFDHDGHKPISRSTIWRWVTRTWERLHKDEERNITPHSFRKLYAVNRRKCGAKLGDISADLNHERIETTMLYAFADMLFEAEADVFNNRTYVPLV